MLGGRLRFGTAFSLVISLAYIRTSDGAGGPAGRPHRRRHDHRRAAGPGLCFARRSARPAELPADAAADPDLVAAGWESTFGADALGDRDGLHRLGVQTYVAPSACRSPGGRPDPLTVYGLERDIRELAAIFDADAEPFIAPTRNQP